MRIMFSIMVLALGLHAWEFMGFGTKTTAKKVEIRTMLPKDVEHEEIEARAHLNAIRETMQMNSLLPNDLLSVAAQGHADYLVANKESSHYEVEGHQKFIGIKPVDRTIYANYASLNVSENLSTDTHSAKSSIDGLFSAIYHRFGFLSPSIDIIGVGVAQEKAQTSSNAFVYVMANSALENLCHEKSFSGFGKYYYKICKDKTHRIAEKAFIKAKNSNKKYNPKILFYPYSGQTDVAPVFYDESPDPLPKYEVSGFPVSVEFNDYYFDSVELLSFELFDSADVKIKYVLLMNKENDPHQHFTDKQFALFPLKRLDYDKTYSAKIRYQIKAKIYTHRWNFHTQKFSEKLYIIKNNNTKLTLAKGESHILYFPPHNAHDLLKSIQYPADVDLTFIDHNTIKITVINDDLDHFSLKSKNRVVHIEMK